MLEINIKEKQDGKWVTVDTPESLTDKIGFIKERVGKDAMIEIRTSKSRTFLCGTESLLKATKERFPDACVMDCESGYNMIQFAPDHFITSIQAFFTEEDAKIVFPDKPAIKPPDEPEHVQDSLDIKPISNKISHIDSRRYHVSMDGGNEYLVDLDEIGGNGFCGCKSFEMTLQKKAEKHLALNRKIVTPYRCKHIKFLIEELNNGHANSVTNYEV